MHGLDSSEACGRLAELVDFLSDPLIHSLFRIHPNELGNSSFDPPLEWANWWDWAGEETRDRENPSVLDPWLLLLQYYDSCRSNDAAEVSPDKASALPQVLQSLVQDACRLAVPRDVGRAIFPSENPWRYDLEGPIKGNSLSVAPPDVLPGMSPKKAHEVMQMSDFIGNMLKSDPPLSSTKYAVDIGAGQGYLSRMLRDRFRLHILALDFSDVQAQGAAKREATRRKSKRPLKGPPRGGPDVHLTDHATALRAQCGDDISEDGHGSLTYVTAKINADTLCQSTRDWVESRRAAIASCPPDGSSEQDSMPVIFVALHACGSLTPDIFRAFTVARKANSSGTSWTPRAAVIVGCCYNMLRPEDFPLSHKLRSSRPNFKLTPSHLQLAAQVPSQWTRSEQTLRDARLALRKIVWRALIQDVLDAESITSASREGDERSHADQEDTGVPEDRTLCEDRRPKRLGRLNDAAYADWKTFAGRVREKLDLKGEQLSRADQKLERRIEVFHVLRCIVGPVIESLILLDRAVWLQEELQDNSLSVELVNLFDQASGSGRNVAIVIRPRAVETARSHQ
ncbi:hypothetical protein BV20DRAFT_971250 [Pilatotrama ljubarskyi]|nr:hypothetical protein BV20DRAFT_971250 [Pilatotrama ljubarskyi]